MGKVKSHLGHGSKALTQWVGRKVRNHDPMSAIDVTAGGHTLRSTQHRNVKDGQFVSGAVYCGIIDSPDRSTVIYGLANGRRFAITVTELDAEQGKPELVKVAS